MRDLDLHYVITKSNRRSPKAQSRDWKLGAVRVRSRRRRAAWYHFTFRSLGSTQDTGPIGQGLVVALLCRPALLGTGSGWVCVLVYGDAERIQREFKSKYKRSGWWNVSGCLWLGLEWLGGLAL